MIKFQFKCSYLGSVWYTVTGDGAPYEVRIRHELSDYALSIANGPDVVHQFRAELGNLRREHGITVSGQYRNNVSAAVLEAFNQWRRDQHDAWIEQWKANPDRYGEFDSSDRLAAAPAPATNNFDQLFWEQRTTAAA